MRKIAANYIFPISSAPIKNGYLIVDNDGCVQDVVDTNGQLKEIENLEYYSGVLMPGFIYLGAEIIFTNVKTTVLQDVLNLENQAHRKIAKFLWSRGVQAIAQNEWKPRIENYSLILDEMLRKTQTSHQDFEFLLKEYTIKRAELLGVEAKLGSFNVGKTPGVLLLSGFNYKAFSITEKTQIKRLV